MAFRASSLFNHLPQPKYTGDVEDLPGHTRPKGIRFVSEHSDEAKSLDIVSAKDIPVNDKLVLCKDVKSKALSTSSNALPVEFDEHGNVKYDAIARRGHSKNRVIHTSLKDLIPLRQRADVGEVSLDRPTEDVVKATQERTAAALAKLVDGAVAAQRPKNVRGTKRGDATYVRYTPASQMGNDKPQRDRIMKIVERQIDPMEPPKFKHKKIPRGPPSPPPPIMHSPPRKLTAEDQEAWKIPPPISNWKNPKGYTVPLDKRLAADGRGLQDVTINDKFSQLSEALYMADRHAREEVRQRAQMQQKLAEKEKLAKEEHLRMLALKAREERAIESARRDERSPRSRSSSLSDDSRYSQTSDRFEEARKRARARRDRNKENERELRKQRMGHERRAQVLAREQGRDISERVILGLAKPTPTAEALYDSRLFNRDVGLTAEFNEDQPFDRPLFVSEGLPGSSIRRGPVTFERDEDDDPFNINQMIEDVQKSGAKGPSNRFGLNSPKS